MLGGWSLVLAGGGSTEQIIRDHAMDRNISVMGVTKLRSVAGRHQGYEDVGSLLLSSIVQTLGDCEQHLKLAPPGYERTSCSSALLVL